MSNIKINNKNMNYSLIVFLAFFYVYNAETHLKLKISCPHLQCNPCDYGYEVNLNGCYTCNCVNPCKYYLCGFGEKCITEPVYCNDGLICGGKAKCVKICLPFICNQMCIYGFDVDCNNCPVCRCAYPCRGVVCPKYHFCSVQKFDTITATHTITCTSLCINTSILLVNGQAIDCFSTNPVENLCPQNYFCRVGPYVCCSV